MQTRHEIPQQFEALWAQFNLQSTDARDVAPGRSKLSTSPISTGLPPTPAKTMGMWVVIVWAALAARTLTAKMRSTPCWTNSRAAAGSAV